MAGPRRERLGSIAIYTSMLVPVCVHAQFANCAKRFAQFANSAHRLHTVFLLHFFIFLNFNLSGWARANIFATFEHLHAPTLRLIGAPMPVPTTVRSLAPTPAPTTYPIAIALALLEIFTLIGVPGVLQSDNGREFSGAAETSRGRCIGLSDEVSRVLIYACRALLCLHTEFYVRASRQELHDVITEIKNCGQLALWCMAGLATRSLRAVSSASTEHARKSWALG